MTCPDNKELIVTSHLHRRGALRWAALALLLGGLPLPGCSDDAATPPIDSGRADTGSAADSGVSPDSGVEGDASPTHDGGAGDVCDEDVTLGNFCVFDADCNDVCFCNGNEVCQGGICARGPSACDDGIECTVDACDEETYSCGNTPDDTVCDDADICTGTEFCDVVAGCVAGLPLNCSDGDSCTLDTCDSVTGCANTIRDLDGDGFADSRCEGGTDCNDDPLTGSLVNPDATEICADGVDNNCDGIADIYDEASCAPTNDTCATPTHLGGTGLYSINTAGLREDYELDCQIGSTNRDAVFSFSTATIRDVIISIPGAPTGTALELRTLANCDADGDGLACDRDTSSYSDEAIVERSALPAGDYAIVVSSPIGAFMNLSLEILSPVPPPREDLCDGSTPVLTASTAVSGDFRTLNDDYAPLGCHGTYAAADDIDAAYRLSVTTPADVTITAAGMSASGSSSTVAVALVSDCVDPVASGLNCEVSAYSTPASLTFVSLPVGEYFIVLEPESTSAVGYALDVQVTIPDPPIPGDTCGNALDVADASATVDISRLRNDGGLGCGGNSFAYRDASFYFDVAVTSDVAVTTNATNFHLYAASTNCTDPSTEFVCQPSSPSGAGITTLSDLAPGRYYLNVSVPSDMGSLDVSTVITPR